MASSARILLVDDDADFCEVLSDRLHALGFQVTVADRGVEALRLVREDAPAVVLLDLVLPGLDGMTVLDTLRREEPDVAVVVITGSVFGLRRDLPRRAVHARPAEVGRSARTAGVGPGHRL